MTGTDSKHNSVVIDGKARAAEIKEQLRAITIPKLKEKYGRVPCLCVIIVGDDPASRIYVRNKVKAAQYVGMGSRLMEFPEDISQKRLLQTIDELNNDPEVDGILVQLPLPEQIDESLITNAIAPCKDVDGFSTANVGALRLREKCIVPCTPKGIMDLLENYGINTDGKNAVVIGRSNIVGKPAAALLLEGNATVTIAHSHTGDLGAITRNADILVTAVGHKGLITSDMVKPGATVIDVGMNRDADGRLCGDVDFESVRTVAGYITPVPGGVGPMTVAMLLRNTVECFKKNCSAPLK